jgi:hypothetical protein
MLQVGTPQNSVMVHGPNVMPSPFMCFGASKGIIRTPI